MAFEKSESHRFMLLHCCRSSRFFIVTFFLAFASSVGRKPASVSRKAYSAFAITFTLVNQISTFLRQRSSGSSPWKVSTIASWFIPSS